MDQALWPWGEGSGSVGSAITGATKFSGGHTASGQGVSHGSECLTRTRHGRPRSDAAIVLWLFVLPASSLPLFRGWQANFPTKTSGFRVLFLLACHLPGSPGLGGSIQILLARRAFCSSFPHPALNRPWPERRTTALTEQAHPQGNLATPGVFHVEPGVRNWFFLLPGHGK
jgi:hypothetical protein